MKAHAISVIRTLRQAGYPAYLVGGCVRDLMLGREPADYDVTTRATPEEVMGLFPETYAVGAQFGVVLVPSPDRTFTVEVATFRSDEGYSDGRRPDSVRYSQDAREDVERRDFTINGLLLDPLNNEVLDYVGGRQDIETRTLRTIGDPARRFAEDKLRLLRAVRFAARLGYKIEPETFAAIRKLAPQIHQVSRERVADELNKMLTEGRARKAFELLDATALLPEVLPEISAMQGVAQPPQYHPEGDVWQHTLLLLENLPQPCSRTQAWGALLHDVGKPPTFRVAPDRIRFDGHVEVGVKMAAEICSRLRFSNADTGQILALIQQHMRFGDLQRMKESTLKKFLRLPKIEEHIEQHRLDCVASHGDLSLYHFAREKLASIPPEKMRPAPLLTGADLIAHGYVPGPQFKRILAAVEDGQLEGRLQSREQALAWAQQEFPL
jgi:poly(A) polymerase